MKIVHFCNLTTNHKFLKINFFEYNMMEQFENYIQHKKRKMVILFLAFFFVKLYITSQDKLEKEKLRR